METLAGGGLLHLTAGLVVGRLLARIDLGRKLPASRLGRALG